MLVVLVDDLGWADVSPNHVETFYSTPNVARLAREGLRFTDGYAACPVCSPTRYALLTGRSPSRIGATDWFTGRREGHFRPAAVTNRMPLEDVTLAELLRASGYATFFAGKWHLGPTEEFWPEAQGFDVNCGGHERGGPYGPGKYFVPYGNPRLTDGPAGEHLPLRLAEETAEFIARHRDTPFLAYLSFYSVHTPLVAPQSLVAEYEERAAALPEVERFGMQPAFSALDDPHRVRIIQDHATYAAMVESMDRALGVVLDRLEAEGLADDTLVIFTSDNGGLSTSEGSPTSNLPLSGGKGWVLEGGIRVPWIVRFPGRVQAGSSSGDLVTSMDLAPTVLDALALEARPDLHLDGRSFASVWRGLTRPERPLFWHYPHYANQNGFPGGAIRVGRWKLVEGYEDGTAALFDLETDVGETTDLSQARPELALELRARLHAWYEEVGANFLRAKPDGPDPWRP